ncbi:P-loop containing nucleoside triphosphate hydrolase protein [Auriculariales sp. MPI-PUGE-AT-0066]|nr:P-loop containing nucleoside triphosphate hydrolase protein [Auriculariales sp. MPI-PUGE-AT-0066]
MVIVAPQEMRDAWSMPLRILRDWTLHAFTIQGVVFGASLRTFKHAWHAALALPYPHSKSGLTMSAALRQARLDKLFTVVTSGKQDVAPQSALFLEALCSQADALTALERLTSGYSALDAFQRALFDNLSVDFLNNRATKVLQFLQHPAFEVVGGGSLLFKVIHAATSPRTIVNAYRAALNSSSLSIDAQLAFAWLVLQLLATPERAADDFELAQDVCSELQKSAHHEVRTRAAALNRRLLQPVETSTDTLGSQPGGRHDNDFVNFKDISILPTAEEIICVKPPHLLTALALTDVSKDERPAIALDNQFRLLREDMVYELREDLQRYAQLKGKIGQRKGRRGFEIEALRLHGVSGVSSDTGRRTPWALQLECVRDLPFFAGTKAEDRRKFLQENKRIIRHQSFACIIIDNQVAAFGEINRDEELLARELPVVILQINGEANTIDTLYKLMTRQPVKLIQVDTAVFAYEPVLKALQRMQCPALAPELFLWDNDALLEPPHMPRDIVELLRTQPSADIGPVLGLSRRTVLDRAQHDSLLAALSQRISLIQGPPGTGKSFVGALAAKILHKETTLTILVCCYTNHALDQFMEDLLDNGIPPSSMVRLGSKSTSRTAEVLLSNQSPVSKLGQADYTEIDLARSSANRCWNNFETAFDRLMNKCVTYGDLLEHLQATAPAYSKAFTVPDMDMILIGKNGKPIDGYYLIAQWEQGYDAGVLKDEPALRGWDVVAIWQMPPQKRQALFQEWVQTLDLERVRKLYELGTSYDAANAELTARFRVKDAAILRSKRIIGCTTTAAAKYMDLLCKVGTDVLLVEEAGEILEAHVLTALGKNTQQMILIGDHQQLRPRVSNYALTVEKGTGFEFNISLFERLINAGYPHSTLQRQHRMRPEISNLVRHLTYTDLVDAAGTSGRPNIRGITNNVVFINHLYSEDEMQNIADTRDGGSKSSKQNSFEVEMAMGTIKYLAQQGYRFEDMAVLTPYLGQLSKLREAFSKSIDLYLSDQDNADLVRAGLPNPGTVKLHNNRLRLSTIDNAQGEEWKIVVISLTRSNAQNDIGFMFSPERLNVLLSRARDGCIIIGNANTFRLARKGGDLWTKLFDYMLARGNIYAGLPVRCEQHPDRKELVSTPAEFGKKSPDGGCLQPCGAMMPCGRHQCPSKCHAIKNHSEIRCQVSLQRICQSKHKQVYRCWERPPSSCAKCEQEAKEEELKNIQLRQEEEQRREIRLAQERDLQIIELELDAQRLLKQDPTKHLEKLKAIRLKLWKLKREQRQSAINFLEASTAPSKRVQPTASNAPEVVSAHLQSFLPAKIALAEPVIVTTSHSESIAKTSTTSSPSVQDTSQSLHSRRAVLARIDLSVRFDTPSFPQTLRAAASTPFTSSPTVPFNSRGTRQTKD